VVDVLEKDGQGLNLTWEVRDGIARHSKGKLGAPVGADEAERARTLEGQIMRIADLVAYVNHDIDDATRAGILDRAALPAPAVAVLGTGSSDRIGRMVKDVIAETLGCGLREIRMSADVLQATLALRSFLFEAVYENELSAAEFRKAADILGGLWTKVREKPDGFVEPWALAAEGLDVATCDFLAGMTDRYAVALFEQLFIPKPWVALGRPFEARAE